MQCWFISNHLLLILYSKGKFFLPNLPTVHPFGEWSTYWIFITVQYSFINCRWCIFVTILYIKIVYKSIHSIPLYCLSILLSNKNMMKAVTSQLMLLQDFGKIGVFVKLRKTFRNSQNWETPMFFLVCWKLH